MLQIGSVLKASTNSHIMKTSVEGGRNFPATDMSTPDETHGLHSKDFTHE